jgi:hypothetical protein
MQQLVTVSMQELDRMKCIEAVIDGSLTPIRPPLDFRAKSAGRETAIFPGDFGV